MAADAAGAVEEFWDRVARYKQLGMDPLKWIAGCAVKVDLTSVVYPALRQIRPELQRIGVKISPRADADVFPSGDSGPKFHRRIYNLGEPNVDPADLGRLGPDRAISLVQVHQRSADKPGPFAEALLRLYRQMEPAKPHFTVGKGHSIITPFAQSQFALFDFIKEGKGSPDGYTVANNDTIQVIDPTLDPASKEQAYVAVSNSLNDLLTLATCEDLQLRPVVDAPTPEMKAQILRNMEAFAKAHGLEFVETPQPETGKLIMGATVVGRIRKEPPVAPRGVEPGMEIVVSRPFGDLAPINVYLSSLADEEYLKKLEAESISLEQARKAKEDVVKTMTRPNIAIGRILNRYCPPFGGRFDPDRHVSGTGDLSGPGVYIFKEFAELAKFDLRLDDLPLKYPEYVEFATREFIMDNGTAGTNGAVAAIGRPSVIRAIADEMRKAGYDPRVIGKVTGPGAGSVQAPKALERYMASRKLLSEFILQ
ncbi:MAG: SelD-related putative sulfur metabolism protein [Halobacteria archaeon]